MAQTSRSADLTSGPMLQKIILFSIPLAASSILQLLFNAADVVVVGRFAGSTALAAVGSNGSLINLLVNLFVGLSLGANVVAARCFGAKDDHGVQDTVQTSVTLGLVSGVLLAVVGFFAARGLLELMSCPEDVIDLSVGVVLAAKDGAYLHTGDTLATIHAKTEADAAAAEEELLKCYTFSDEAPVRPPFIRGVVT